MTKNPTLRTLMHEKYGIEQTEVLYATMLFSYDNLVSNCKAEFNSIINETFLTDEKPKMGNINTLTYLFSLKVKEYLDTLPAINNEISFTVENLDVLLENNKNNSIRKELTNNFRNKVFYKVFEEYMLRTNEQLIEGVNLKSMYDYILCSEKEKSKDIKTDYTNIMNLIRNYEGFLFSIKQPTSEDDNLLYV